MAKTGKECIIHIHYRSNLEDDAKAVLWKYTVHIKNKKNEAMQSLQSCGCQICLGVLIICMSEKENQCYL